MDIEITDDLSLREEERNILEGIVDDTLDRFEQIINFAAIQTVNIGGPTEYHEANGRPMTNLGNSPPLWRHNPFEEGEIQIYVQDAVHIPHELAHQIQDVYEVMEKSATSEEPDLITTDSATEKAFYETFAYLNQLQYFDLPDAYDVEFDEVEQLRQNEITWKEYEENAKEYPDLHHPAGYQLAITLDQHDVEPNQVLANSEEYGRAAEDAVAAAWLSGITKGNIERQNYDDVVERSFEENIDPSKR